MDDLGIRLAEAADRATQLARDPGPAALRRRARSRRRRRAGGAALALVLVAAVVVIGRGGGLGLPTADPSGQDRWRQLPWRGLQASEWKATVPGETPRDPVVAAAEGERAGVPWRLVVYRSTYRPGGGRPAVADVCFLLDWFAMGAGPPNWQAHGSCSPELQAASVLTAGAGGTFGDEVAVIGRAPATASRVRLELSGRAPVEAQTVAAPAVPGRFYAAFVPKASHLRRMVALDPAGRAVGMAPGQGDLNRELGGYPPTGPVTVVATTTDRFAGRLELVAWPIRDGFCLALWGPSGCGARALEPDLHCSRSRVEGQAPIRLRLVVGGVPRTARTVLVEVGGERVTVPTRDGGELFDRSFFLANFPPGARLRGTVRVSALDAGGTRVGTWTLQGCD